MGEIIFSQAGAVIGQAALPNGISVLGAQISGAAIGSALGGLAGRAVDTALMPALEGPRIKALHVTESREGAGMPNVYGRMRVGGQIIWASRFREKRRTSRSGKGGPKTTDYSYTVSFAVAICEGVITRLGQVWANGEPLALSDYGWRLYKGGDGQLPDPLIEAIEGSDAAPAYRGCAYIVFEDMPLDRFGHRLPQLSFEVVRAGSPGSGLASLVSGVNIIPASGEFVYGTDIVRDRRFPAIERPLNMNNGAGEADFLRALDQLETDLPSVNSAALTVAWFGDDLRAGLCRLRPGVETHDRITVPYSWMVAGKTRDTAYLVSQSGGNANFGGTPSDRAVIEGIAAMKAQGLAVTLSPFLLMDIPSGNGLADPYGADEQAAFPWRGRITVSEDGTAAARAEIETFLGEDDDFGYRHFILHHARLAVEAGGVEAILIGSEMVALTRVRDETGSFPFAEGLVQLASDVRAIVGPGTKVSYAADWTEYGAYVPSDGSGDVLFPLDAVWTSPDIDFVGVDWYPPAGDWRDGNDHLDALAGYSGADDPDYLASQMAGGEGFDWYYASAGDRDSQVRTPIIDTAHGEDWVFRQKDLGSWWANAHHERPGGLRDAGATAWTGGLKPVRLMEIGFPAVDKGGNAPNLFHDPKSSESALPPYSSGARDDGFQRRALEAALAHWQGQAFVEGIHVWAWDARPWPDFPARETVWADGPNWSFGHWLNGRTGLISAREVIEDMGRRSGIDVDASGVPGLVEGFVLDGPMPFRRALDPFGTSAGLACLEREDGLILTLAGQAGPQTVPESRLAGKGVSLTRNLLDKRPGRLMLTYISADGSYAPATVDARSDEGDAGYGVDASLPLVLSDAAAGTLAAQLLSATLEADTAEITLPPEFLSIEPGDHIEGAGLDDRWTVSDIVDDGIRRTLSLQHEPSGSQSRALAVPSAPDQAIAAPAPELVLVDGPALTGPGETGPLAAVSADPWTGPVSISAGAAAVALTERAICRQAALMGRLLEPLSSGPHGRWDRAASILVELHGGDLASADELSVLSGANRVLVAGPTGWELISYLEAELVSASLWRLTGLLRGLAGTLVSSADTGSICIVVDEALVPAPLEPAETGLPLFWKAGTAEVQTFTFGNRARLPWTIAHLRAIPASDGNVALSWIARGADIPDNWDLPDPAVPRLWTVEADTGGVITYSMTTGIASALIPSGHDVARVAEVAADGRHGPWVSIALGDA